MPEVESSFHTLISVPVAVKHPALDQKVAELEAFGQL